MFHIKSVEKIETHILCLKTFFTLGNRGFYKICEKIL